MQFLMGAAKSVIQDPRHSQEANTTSDQRNDERHCRMRAIGRKRFLGYPAKQTAVAGQDNQIPADEDVSRQGTTTSKFKRTIVVNAFEEDQWPCDRRTLFRSPVNKHGLA